MSAIYDLEKVFQLRNKNNPEVEIRFVTDVDTIRRTMDYIAEVFA